MYSPPESPATYEWDKQREKVYRGMRWLVRFVELDVHTGWDVWLVPEMERQKIFVLFFDWPLPKVDDYYERTMFVNLFSDINARMKALGYDKHPTTEKKYIERCDQIYEHMGGRKYIVL